MVFGRAHQGSEAAEMSQMTRVHQLWLAGEGKECVGVGRVSSHKRSIERTHEGSLSHVIVVHIVFIAAESSKACSNDSVPFLNFNFAAPGWT